MKVSHVMPQSTLCSRSVVTKGTPIAKVDRHVLLILFRVFVFKGTQVTLVHDDFVVDDAQSSSSSSSSSRSRNSSGRRRGWRGGHFCKM